MTIPPKGSYPIKYFLRKGYLQIKKVQFNAQDGRHVDGPPSLFGWSGIPSLEKISIDIQIVLTERGAGRVKGVEVIKVMHQKGDMVVSLGHPLHKVQCTKAGTYRHKKHHAISYLTTGDPLYGLAQCGMHFVHQISP